MAATKKLDFSAEIQAWKDAKKGKEVRAAQMSALEKTQITVNEAVDDVNQASADVEEAVAQASADVAEVVTQASADVAEAVAESNDVTESTRQLRDELQEMKDNDYWRGPQGVQGPSGVTAPSSGMFTLALDPATGDLYAMYPDGATPPQFEYDKESGNLYYIINE